MSMTDFYKDLLAFMKQLKKKYKTPKYDKAINDIKLQLKTKKKTNERIVF